MQYNIYLQIHISTVYTQRKDKGNNGFSETHKFF